MSVEPVGSLVSSPSAACAAENEQGYVGLLARDVPEDVFAGVFLCSSFHFLFH